MNPFEEALQYLADKMGRGPARGNSTTNKAAQFTSEEMPSTGTAGVFMNSADELDRSDPVVRAAEERNGRIVAETPLRVPSAIANTVDLLPRMFDAYRSPDFINEQPKEGEYGPKVREVGALEAFGQAEYGTRSSDDVQREIRERLQSEVENGQLDPADSARVDARAVELRDGLKRTHRAFIKDTLEDGVSDLVGAPRDQDKTAGERVLQAGLMALLPNPAPAGRAASIATELLMPGVNAKHYTGGALALNAGISAGSQAAMEAYVAPTADDFKTPVVDNEDGTKTYARVDPVEGKPIVALDLTDDDDDDVPFMENVRKTLGFDDMYTSANFFGTLMAGIAAAKKPNALNAAVTPSIPHPITGMIQEPTVKPEVVHERGGVSGAMARQADEFAPVERAAKNAGIDNQEAIEIVAKNTDKTGSNGHANISNWAATGKYPNSTVVDPYPVRAFMQDHAKAVEMGVEKELDVYLAAKSALRSREKFIAHTSAEVTQYNSALKSAQNRGDAKAVQEYTEKLNELHTTWQNVIKDAPPSLQQYDMQQLIDIVKAGDADQFMSGVSANIAKRNEAQLDYLHDIGGLDTPSYTNLIGEVGHYLPTMHDPLHGKTGFARTVEKTKQWLKSETDDPHGEGKQYHNAEGAYKARRLDNGESAVNAHMHWTDALKHQGEHVIRFAQRNEFRRNIVDDLRAKGDPVKLEGVMESLNIGGTVHTRKKWDTLFSKMNSLDKDDYIPIIRGDKIEFVKFKDPIVHNAMKLPPTMSGWFVKLTQSIQKPFRTLTTGDLSGYQGMSSFLDTQTIGYTRRIGDVFGLDYAALKGITLANAASKRLGGGDLLSLDGNIAKTAMGVGRVADQMTVNMIPFMLNITTALQTFAKTYGNHIGTALAGDISSRSVFFQNLEKMFPGTAQNVGNRMMSAYKNSLINIASEGHVMHNPQFRRMRQDMKEVDKFFSDYDGAMLGKMTLGIPQEAWEIWKHAITAMESSARIGLAMRNIEMDAHRLAGGDWRKLPKSVIDKHIKNARTDAGDFGRRAGPKLQKLTAVVPYSGVVLKTMRAGASRVFDHSDPKTAVAMMSLAMTGAIIPRLTSDFMMTNTNDYLRDYYYNKLADFQREEAIFYPRISALKAWYSGNKEETDKLTEKDFYKVSLEQLFRPLASAVSGGMRAAGFYNTAGDVNEQSGWKQLGLGLAQALGLPTPPAWNAALYAASGGKWNTSNMFELRSPLEQASASASGRSGAYDALNVGSHISSEVAQFIAILTGPGGGRLAQAFDTGWQTLEDNDGKHYIDAILAAGKEFGQRTQDSSSRFDVPGLSELDKALQENTGVKIPFVGRAADRVYSRNSTSETVKAMRELMSVVSGPSNRIGPDGTGLDELDFIISDIRDFTKNAIHPRTGESYKELSDEWRDKNELVQANDADRTKSFATRNDYRIHTTKQMQEITIKQAEMLREMEETIAKDWGFAYKVKFKEDFTMKSLVEKVQEAKRKGIAVRKNEIPRP